MKNSLSAFVGRNRIVIAYVVFVIALTSMIGSLLLSELVHLVPCVLCWYQRILMYPLVVITGVGILLKDRNWVFYALPLSITGVVVAFYHSLLQWGIIPETIAPCNAAVSCATKQVDILGFITIPFLSFLAFGAITSLTVALFLVRRTSQAR